MGRELKRVPMDFNWPRNKTWGGYLNPFSNQSVKCADCDGSGYSPKAKCFHDQWYGYAPFEALAYGATPLAFDDPVLVALARRNVEHSPGYYGTDQNAVKREQVRLFRLFRGKWSHHLIQADVDALLAEGRLMDFTHTPRTEEQCEIVRAKLAAGGNSWLPESNGYRPMAEEVNTWSLSGFGHDGINQYICLRARCERERVTVECSRCGGSGTIWPTPEIERMHEDWEPVEPPKGDGYQLWETTSEGSPISPVFATLDELCKWAEGNATTFGSNMTTADKWKQMLDDGFVCHREGNAIFV